MLTVAAMCLWIYTLPYSITATQPCGHAIMAKPTKGTPTSVCPLYQRHVTTEGMAALIINPNSGWTKTTTPTFVCHVPIHHRQRGLIQTEVAPQPPPPQVSLSCPGQYNSGYRECCLPNKDCTKTWQLQITSLQYVTATCRHLSKRLHQDRPHLNMSFLIGRQRDVIQTKIAPWWVMPTLICHFQYVTETWCHPNKDCTMMSYPHFNMSLSVRHGNVMSSKQRLP